MALKKSMNVSVVREGSGDLVGSDEVLEIRSAMGSIWMGIKGSNQAINLEAHEVIHLIGLLAGAIENNLDAW